jgi:hypothetical protein
MNRAIRPMRPARESADQIVMTTAILIALTLSGLVLLFSTPDKLVEAMEGLPEVRSPTVTNPASSVRLEHMF